MQSSLKPALDTLDKALIKLEKSIDKRLAHKDKAVAPSSSQVELALDIQHERELNRLLASKLDMTIERLETLLGEEQ